MSDKFDIRVRAADPSGKVTLTVRALDDEITEGEPVRYRIEMSKRTGWITVTLRFLYQGTFMYTDPSYVDVSIRSKDGQLHADFEAPTLDDGKVEENGHFKVILQAKGEGGKAVDYKVGTPKRAFVRILDNDAGTPTGSQVSIIDRVRVQEGPGAVLSFPVTLDRPLNTTATVDWETVNGSAKAGKDYVAGKGTLTFSPGQTEKTINVEVIDDTHDEGRENMIVLLSNASGTAYDGNTRSAVGTIENDDPMPHAWLARFGREAARHVVEAIDARLRGEASSGVVFGGHRLEFGADPRLGETETQGGADSGRLARDAPELDFKERFDPETGQEVIAHESELTMPELLLASSFHLASAREPDTDSRWSLWGRGARSSFSGAEDEVALDGDVTTAMLGVDFERDSWLAGVTLARSAGEGSFRMNGECDLGCTGEVESVLTGLYPYARYRASERLDLWGALGHARGDLTLSPRGVEVMGTGVDMSMAAFGARGVVLPAAKAGGFELALRADASLTATGSDAATDLAETGAETSRQRLVLEASHAFGVGEAGMLMPTVEVGYRKEGGDAETGDGLEVGGAVRSSFGGLAVDVGARSLLASSESDYEEWGVSGSVYYAPGARGRGLSMRLATVKGAAYGDAEHLWAQPYGGFRTGAFDPVGYVDAEVAYGVDAWRGLVTPYVGVAHAPGADTWRSGVRWSWKPGSGYDVKLVASVTAPGGDAQSKRGVLLQVSRRW